MSPSRARSKCVKVKTSSGRARSRKVDRSCSPYTVSTRSSSRSHAQSRARSDTRGKHSKYCECDDCRLLFNEGQSFYTLPSWLSMKSIRKSNNWTAVISLIVFFVILRTLAFTFPYGLFKSTAYGFEMGSVGSRVLFTLQQHIWTMIPLMFGSRTGTLTFTLHLLINTVVLSTLITEVYMRYIASVIITSAVYTLLGRYSDSPSWRAFFNFPRQFVNASLTLICIKQAMDTKALTGLNLAQ